MDPTTWTDIELEPGWIDFNGHLNMASYLTIFDRAIDRLMRSVGLSDQPGEGATLFAAEAKLRYLREVPPDARPECLTRIRLVAPKRLWSVQELRSPDGTLHATCENLHLHVMRTPDGSRVREFDPGTATALERLVDRSRLPDGLDAPVAAGLSDAAS